jgi:hypothetical protein
VIEVSRIEIKKKGGGGTQKIKFYISLLEVLPIKKGFPLDYCKTYTGNSNNKMNFLTQSSVKFPQTQSETPTDRILTHHTECNDDWQRTPVPGTLIFNPYPANVENMVSS